MTALRRYGSPTSVPQSQGLPGMTPNNAGGFAYTADDWTRLRRFLIMGTDGGTYYVGEQKLTRENIDVLHACAADNPQRVLDEIHSVLVNFLAPKPEYAIFALAYMTAHDKDWVRKLAVDMIPEVLGIGTHLFQFANFVEMFRGWGSALRRGVANWYLTKEPRQLAYQVTKYQQRDGWSHRDLLRLSHPKAQNGTLAGSERNAILHYVTQSGLGSAYEVMGEFGEYPADGLEYIEAVEQAKVAGKDETISLINRYGLTREMLNTEYLSDPDVQSALLQRMPMTALVRNLGNLTRLGLFKNWSEDLKTAVGKLTNEKAITRSGIHPVTVLNALKTYEHGGGFRSNNTWVPDSDILSALNQTFRTSFKNVEPSNKKTLIGLDVSGSMSMFAPTGLDNLTCAEAAAAMLMATYEAEPFVQVMSFSHEFKPLPVQRGMDLGSVLQKTRDRNFGRTDCALPMEYALSKGLDIDAFVVYTDSETWYGRVHPMVALEEYRRKMQKPDAKLIVVAMASNHVSIADPNDKNTLDVAGFDSSAPQVIAQFMRDEL